MKNFFKIYCTVMLTVIFFTFGASTASAEIFSNDIVDEDYDFSKLKKVFVLEVDTSIPDTPIIKEQLELHKNDLNKASKTYVKKMKCKLVSKELADAFIEIKIKNWKRAYSHTVPEREVTYYEGYKEVRDSFSHRPPPPPKDKRGRHNFRAYRPPPPKRRIWTTSSTWFSGSTEKKKIIAAYDVYRSEVKAVFEIHDAKSGRLIMSREGSIENFYGTQINLYKEPCEEFFKSFRKIVKQVKESKT